MSERLTDKLASAPPREVCEHGSQKVKCPICELSDAYAEIERLRAALREIVEVDSGNDVEMDAYNMHRIAKEALGDGRD